VEKETAIPRTANIILSASGPVRGACDPPRPQIVEQLLVPLAPDFRRETKAATKPDSYPAVGERPALSPGDETPHGESANFHLLQPVQVIISGRFWVIAEGFAQTQVYPSGIPQGSATNGYGPYDWLNVGNALKTYKMACFRSGVMTGADTCLYRDIAGHFSVYDGRGVQLLGQIPYVAGTFDNVPVTAVAITDTNFLIDHNGVRNAESRVGPKNHDIRIKRDPGVDRVLL
jgi:hypothetical protein